MSIDFDNRLLFQRVATLEAKVKKILDELVQITEIIKEINDNMEGHLEDYEHKEKPIPAEEMEE